MAAEMTGTAGQLPLPLAMAYVPPQKWTIVYDPDDALQAGTLFPALHLPFEGGHKK
ncbi:MAG: spore coat associated protein CotJA [Clostridia bacterium]|nr:spore coat associated protein CotJA [Clostridia bacterium]